MAKFDEQSASEESSDYDDSSDEEVFHFAFSVVLGLIQFTFIDSQLRAAFRKGLIKPGLNVQVKPTKIFANNTVSRLILLFDWLDS